MRGTPAPRSTGRSVPPSRRRPAGPAFRSASSLSVPVEDEDGAFRWGEVGCNVPSRWPEHRARLAGRIGDVGAVDCPHDLGGAVGLRASAQLLAAVGGPGSLERDVDANPLRAALCGPILPVVEATAPLLEGPGLGAEPDPAVLRAFSTLTLELRADGRAPAPGGRPAPGSVRPRRSGRGAREADLGHLGQEEREPGLGPEHVAALDPERQPKAGHLAEVGSDPAEGL